MHEGAAGGIVVYVYARMDETVAIFGGKAAQVFQRLGVSA
jgi:hypothetical protein